MRDKRQSTPANGEVSRGAARPTAVERVPEVFAAELRRARQNAGLSQDALAREMTLQGLNWRQTTVAKTEKADRPILFTEVIALSRILGKSVEDFISTGGPLDQLVERLNERADIAKKDLQSLRIQLNVAREAYYEARISQALASAALQYRDEGDSSPLLEEVQRSLEEWGYGVLQAHDVYRSLDITADELTAIDLAALRALINQEAQMIVRLPPEKLDVYSGEYIDNLHDFLAGKDVEESFLDRIRRRTHWGSMVAIPLTDLLMARINAQLV